MKLPQIVIEFNSKAQSIITRSERGVVAVVLKDDTEEALPMATYKSLAEVDFTTMTEENYQYLKLVFESSPSKVIVVTIPTTEEDYSKALSKLEIYKWNYLTVPSADAEASTTISSWIKSQRTNNKILFVIIVIDHSTNIIIFKCCLDVF